MNSSSRHYYQVTKIYLGINSLGEFEYHIEASVNKITGIGKTIEEAFENLKDKLQWYENHLFGWED